MKTEFRTIESESESYFKEKGSKFYSFAFPIADEDEAKNKLKEVKDRFKDARHHCYAFKLGAESELYRYSDDGEPANTAGKPIYGQLNSFDVTNVLIVVVRYFGGVKLGVGGLIQAYREGAKTALENAKIITKEVTTRRKLHFKYEDMNVMMSLVKVLDLNIVEQEFEMECYLTVEFPIQKLERVEEKLANYPQLEVIPFKH